MSPLTWLDVGKHLASCFAWVLILSTESVLIKTSMLYFSGFANFGDFGGCDGWWEVFLGLYLFLFVCGLFVSAKINLCINREFTLPLP